jgi:NhaP-type Na+/H+ or K+/H+ antiporter
MQTPAILCILIIGLAIGYVGRGKTLGFWGYFLISVLLSPIGGVLALAISEWFANRKPTEAKTA